MQARRGDRVYAAADRYANQDVYRSSYETTNSYTVQDADQDPYQTRGYSAEHVNSSGKRHALENAEQYDPNYNDVSLSYSDYSAEMEPQNDARRRERARAPPAAAAKPGNLQVVGRSLELKPRYISNQYSPTHAEHNAKVLRASRDEVLVAPGYQDSDRTPAKSPAGTHLLASAPGSPSPWHKKPNAERQGDWLHPPNVDRNGTVIGSLIDRFRYDPPTPGDHRRLATDIKPAPALDAALHSLPPSQQLLEDPITGGLAARLRQLNDLIQAEMDHYQPLTRSIDRVPDIAKVVTHNDKVEQIWVDAARGMQHKAAVDIQRLYRGHQGRAEAQRRRNRAYALDANRRRQEEDDAAVAIQAGYRGYMARRKLLQQQYEDMLLDTREEAAMKIQAVYKGRLTRKQYKAWRDERRAALDAKKREIAAVKIQAAARGRIGRQQARQLRERQAAATDIQRVYRGRLARGDLQIKQARQEALEAEERRRHECAALIQAGYKGFLTRRELREQHEASTRIQAAFRGKQARTLTARLKYERDVYGYGASKAEESAGGFEDPNDPRTWAATKIQALQRGRLTRRSVEKERAWRQRELQRHDAASRIQAGWRGTLTRRQLLAERRAQEREQNRKYREEQKRVQDRAREYIAAAAEPQRVQERSVVDSDDQAANINRAPPASHRNTTDTRRDPQSSHWTTDSWRSSPAPDASHMSAEMARVRQQLTHDLDSAMRRLPGGFSRSGPPDVRSQLPTHQHVQPAENTPALHPDMDRQQWEREQAAALWREEKRRQHEESVRRKKEREQKAQAEWEERLRRERERAEAWREQERAHEREQRYEQMCGPASRDVPFVSGRVQRDGPVASYVYPQTQTTPAIRVRTRAAPTSGGAPLHFESSWPPQHSGAEDNRSVYDTTHYPYRNSVHHDGYDYFAPRRDTHVATRQVPSLEETLALSSQRRREHARLMSQQGGGAFQVPHYAYGMQSY